MRNRNIVNVRTPRASQGFLGHGHTAIPVIDGSDYRRTNPFILLMDDQLNLPGGQPVGGAHPHAGIETVTLILEAASEHGFEGMNKGDVEWMTAGKGIVHGEDITSPIHTRLLQLWLVLPKTKRWTTPKTQHLRAQSIPVRRETGAEVRIYSGVSGGIPGKAENETPVTLIEVSLSPHAEINQEVPSSYNGFIYMIEGSAEAGEQPVNLVQGQTGWLDEPQQEEEESRVQFRAGAKGARFVLYAGQPQEGDVVHHGPFIGESSADISRLYREFREGKMKHVREYAQTQV